MPTLYTGWSLEQNLQGVLVHAREEGARDGETKQAPRERAQPS